MAPKSKKTIADLVVDTQAFEKSMGGNRINDALGIDVGEIISNVVPGVKMVEFHSYAKSQRDPKKPQKKMTTYHQEISFFQVEIGQEETATTPLAFSGKAGEQLYIEQLDSHKHLCGVWCSCMDYRFRFEYPNQLVGANLTGKVRAYVRRTTTYPEVNPQDIPGMCKHLLKLVKTIGDRGIMK